jgi:geranylgeranyl pyrophosphate synthase
MATSAEFSFRAWTAGILPLFEAKLLAQFANARPNLLVEACRYPLQTGGKRIRPLLAFGAAEAIGGSAQAALDVAVAVELLHTYSLVHDDLPCMDNDDERRGRPTVHKVYGDGVAVLVGDALLTEAFAVLADAGRAGALVRELAAAGGAGGMIAGQAYDVGMDGPIADVDRLRLLHRAKTGALIRGAVRLGAIAAGAGDAHLEQLTRYAEEVGLAFQVHDDVLDADQDNKPGGPPSFVKLLGLDGARAVARGHMQAALDALVGLPRPEPLAAIAVYTVERSV